MIVTALAPYRTGEGRFIVSGPRLVVKSRQALALSLAIHELATNAIKYGALSNADGHVSITWLTENGDAAPNFVFIWREAGGPTAMEPSTAGFGSRLIGRVLQDDFDGTVEMSYQSTGLVCRLTAPVKNLGAGSE